MGVWIETLALPKEAKASVSHPVWVCGLKHLLLLIFEVPLRHTLYGCVDRNKSMFARIGQPLGHTLYGCVD